MSTDEQSSAAPDGGPTEPIHVEGPDHLDELADRHDVVLVDFYADWCAPCVVLEDFVVEIAEETTAAVAKVDVDVEEGLAADHGVRSIPTVVVYSDGEVAERLVGLQDKEDYVRIVERLEG